MPYLCVRFISDFRFQISTNLLARQEVLFCSLHDMESDKHEICISLESVREARARISPLVRCTPVLTSNTFNELARGRELFFKSEFLQKTGSFKARGASNAVLKNDYQAVVTHSSGNHGQALAWAAKMRSIPAHIVMPSNSPRCKVDAVRAYGGLVTFCEPNLASRESTSKGIMEQTGASFVHPYNDADVMSGQGTMALELLEQVITHARPYVH